MKTTKWVRLGVAMTATIMAAFPLGSSAGKPGGASTATALRVNVLTNFYDAHDTNAFNSVGDMCGPLSSGRQLERARVLGDPYVERRETALTWTEMFAGKLAPISNPSSVYEDGRDPGMAPLRAQFISSDRVLTIDTTTTNLEGTLSGPAPRGFTLDFEISFNPTNYNSYPTTAYPFGDQTVTVPGLFEVLGSQSSLLNMKSCTTAGCKEGTQITYARYWFKDPKGSGQQYRLDWNFTRIIRIDANTWYFIGGDCDGSQTAGLSVLEGNRTKPRMVNMGWFEMPFLFKVTKK